MLQVARQQKHSFVFYQTPLLMYKGSIAILARKFCCGRLLAAVEKMFTILEDWRQVHQFTARVLNMGGGFGVQYTQQDEPLAPATFVEKLFIP